MPGQTLSTVIRFYFKDDTFDVKTAAAIKSQGRNRPAIDTSVTDTIIAMMNALFHTTNIPLQSQFKRYQLMFKSFLLAFFLVVFAFIIIFIVFENNRPSSDSYTSIEMSNTDLIFMITYISMAGALIVALALCLIYRRLYTKLRDQWRNECVRNLCESAAVWSMQFPIIQFQTKYPGFMYKNLWKEAIKKSRKSFKGTKKAAKKSKKDKKKKLLRSPNRSNVRSPMGFKSGFSSFMTSPAKYDRLVEPEETKMNTCKLGVCCCLVEDHWGFIRVFYKYDGQSSNDAVQYALNQLQQSNCLIDQDEPMQQNQVQIVQMVQSPQRARQYVMAAAQAEESDSEAGVDVELMEGSG